MTGTGVVVLVGNRILGGDANYYYSGNFALNDALFRAEVEATHFAGPLNNIFGPLRSVKLAIEGAASESLIMAQGFDPRLPTRRISIKLQKSSPL